MLAVFSFVYWIFFVLTLPFLFAVALVVFVLTAPFDPRRVALQLWSCAWASFYVVVNPLWRSRVVGREKLPWNGAAVLVANHLSMLDILVLYGVFRPFKWVSKAELFRVPFVGWNMWLNDCVPVWRGDRESVRKMMAHCRAHLARGAPVMIFPEGTRSPDGRLQAFKDGAFRLAVDANVPVIPIAVSGTSEALPKHGMVLRQRMRAEVHVLDPIHPSAFDGPAALREAVRDAIAAALPPEHRPGA
ncbi:1-acyl-sn-glycerol-3-phosphate acyltransferase [Anaeromyxobacter dehalogenans 2CP-1]|uniref:1-acyl-sn-glycerol-3-phosphate acyltransferase n=1 Tax=Anaeromyxobacter dehalogenans (strain ATCC BAA-258 / DSM 21875 / 2CP-1) TaxID=455488 RepID=B8J9T2_ANAD2|nr:lysophospholipid acyltransferase family protein [Anaeromyxobacter dehalogenans]ACL63635.1 1-acyl-sn-glycerol-3-phosphate acyltransferase [Anaeromyxobacter dehalogenans 2CP-1]